MHLTTYRACIILCKVVKLLFNNGSTVCNLPNVIKMFITHYQAFIYLGASLQDDVGYIKHYNAL